jgi:hypothetical protein
MCFCFLAIGYMLLAHYHGDLEVGHCDVCKKALYGGFYALAPAIVFASLCAGYARYFRRYDVLAAILFLVVVHLMVEYSSLKGSVFLGALLILMFTVLMANRINHESVPVNTPRPCLGGHAIAFNTVDLGLLLCLCFLLVPVDAELVASNAGIDYHKVSFLIGPSLYSYGYGLVPGLDFHSHYGIAIGPVFWWLLGDGWKAAATHAVSLTIVLTFAFYVQCYFLILYLTNSRSLAALCVMSVAVLNFSSGAHFYSPSAFPARYPLLIPFIICFAWFCVRSSWIALTSMAACACLSLLWQTEIGVLMLLAGISGILVREWAKSVMFVRVFLFVAISQTTFLILTVGLFGSRVLSLEFAYQMIYPPLLYGEGFYGEPLKWDTGWSFLYNLPLQVIGVATIGWCWHFFSREKESTDSERIAAGLVLMLSVTGLLMLVKWVNRSLDAVWHQNAMPLLIVALWWTRVWWSNTALSVQFGKVRSPMRAIPAFLGAATLGLALLFVQDRANPHLYALRSYARYPSLLNAVLAPTSVGVGLKGWDAELTKISKADIDLIKENTGLNKRALIVSPVDWAYLAAAQYAPAAYFVPLIDAFNDQFVVRSFIMAEKVFVDKAFLEGKLPPHPETSLVLAILKNEFRPLKDSDTLILFRRDSKATVDKAGERKQ